MKRTISCVKVVKNINLFNKKNKETHETLSFTQVSEIPKQNRDIYVSTQRTMDLLHKIACEPNKFKAIETIIDETPDGKMAYNNYLRLANQGIDIELYNRNTNRRVKKYDVELRSFCSALGVNNSEGLDGFLDQLHGSAISKGAMACEVVVKKNVREIEDVFLIDPATIYEYKWLENEHRYAMYQQRSDGKKIDLYNGNFFYVPHQPKPSRPDGTLQFLPAVITLTHFYQLLSDSLKVMYRVAYPRYKVSIDLEALMNTLTPEQKSTVAKQQEAFQAAFNDVKHQMALIGKESDIVTTSNNTVDLIGGGVNGSGLDVRAWFEVMEPLIVNSFTMTPVLMGRLKSGSYSLGTVEFKIVTDTVDSMRRGSKRMLEDIINMWARVKGYPIYAKVEHKPINWEVEKTKWETELLKVEKARRSEEYGWIDHDTAAMIGANAEKSANNNSKDYYEYLSHSFGQEQQNVADPNDIEKQKESAGDKESEQVQKKNK